MPSLIPLTQDALDIIQRILGKTTADLYARHYLGKSDKEIILSLRELLTEVIGPKKAEEEIGSILNRHPF